MRLHVAVNGPPEKTNGVRVRELFRDLAMEHDVTFLYRDDAKKLHSTRCFYHSIARAVPHIVYVEGMGYSGILAALGGKLQCRSKMILSTGDAVYAFARSTMSMVKAQAMRAMETAALALSDAIIVWGPYHQELLKQQGHANVFWIPGGVDCSVFRPMEAARLRKDLGLHDSLTIGVVGSINFSRRYEFCYGWEIIETLRHFRGQPVMGMIVGVGDGLPFLRERVRQYDVDDQVIFTGWVDHEKLPEYINAIDVCVSTQSNDLVGQVRITAKVPEYLACGRYIIASDVGGAREFVRESGVLLPYEGVKHEGYIEALVEHTKRILADRSILRVGLKGVQTAKQYFDYTILRPRLREVINFLNEC